jgi:hypothetical protein
MQRPYRIKEKFFVLFFHFKTKHYCNASTCRSFAWFVEGIHLYNNFKLLTRLEFKVPRFGIVVLLV